MSSSPRDDNNIPARLACLNTDTVQGTHLVPINILGDRIMVSLYATKNFTMVPIDPRDENYVGCWLFQGTDGLTYPAVATAEGKLLIDN